MTLTTKFRKDLTTLQSAVNREIYLDVKNPKLYKKVKRYYQNEVNLTGEDPERDYEILMEVLSEDLSHKQTANPGATNSVFDGYR